MKKTYYMVLGVSQTESPAGIRAAYRDRVRRLHPDIAGDGSTRAFQELTTAYDVLSDPHRRREYNALLDAGDRPIHEPTSILAVPETIHPSFEALYDRIARSFTGIGVPKSERIEALDIEVMLAPDEAASGCTVPVGIPTFHRCPQCRGAGTVWTYPCTHCRQSGMVETEQLVHVRIPPGVPSGVIYEIALHGLGIHDFRLRIHVLVGAA
jgi:molecular chaperone DnaJ